MRDRLLGTKLERATKGTAVGAFARGSLPDTIEPAKLRESMSKELLGEIDLEKFGKDGRERLVREMRSKLIDMTDRRRLGISTSERENLIEAIIDNLVGLGPLEPLTQDPNISDILINGPKSIYVERRGKLEKANIQFDDSDHLMRIIGRIVAAVGRRVDESNAMVDARMQDGSRFNAIIPPLALDGPCVSIRRFGKGKIKAQDLVTYGSMPQQMLDMLAACVKAKMNIVVSGGTGTGKTTMLGALSSFIPGHERIITIEDSAELLLQQDHVIRLESRPSNAEGKGEITQGDLLNHALRMRPDRIILGEVRGKEALDMLNAMNTGNDGSMATVHANSPQDALSRFETMVSISMSNMGDEFIRAVISSALDLIVQLERLPDGKRRTIAITEVAGIENGVIITNDVCLFDQTDIVEGQVKGVFRSARKPSFLGRLKKFGMALDEASLKFEVPV